MDHPRITDQHIQAYASVNSMATEGIGFELYRPHPWHGLAPGVEPPRLSHARVVGGLLMIDNGAADKIIAVLHNDNIWGEAADIDDMPARLVERLRHYFETYKTVPGSPSPAMIDKVCGVAQRGTSRARGDGRLQHVVWRSDCVRGLRLKPLTLHLSGRMNSHQRKANST